MTDRISVFTPKYRIAIVVIEHTNKDKGGNPVRRAAGSHGKSGVVDNLVLYERTEMQITMHVRGRNVDEATIRMVSNPRTWRINVVGPNQGIALRDIEQQVYSWLCQNRGEHRPTAVARGTGLSREATSRALAAMANCFPPWVHGEGATSSRTYVALPEPVSCFMRAVREGRGWGNGCTPWQADPDLPDDDDGDGREAAE